MTDAAKALVLPDILDVKAAGPLQAELLAHRGCELVLDASDVQRLGGLCRQVWRAARGTWRSDGVNLRLGSVSQAWDEQWAAFGAPDFNTEGALA